MAGLARQFSEALGPIIRERLNKEENP